jgi:hypothetical protein
MNTLFRKLSERPENKLLEVYINFELNKTSTNNYQILIICLI